MKDIYFKHLFPSLLIATVLSSCYKPVEKKKKDSDVVEDTQVENVEEVTTTKYSLEISSNIELPSISYSINVDDLTQIESGTEVRITNIPGKYRIFMYKDMETNQVLSYERNYSFHINKDTKIMIYSVYDQSYYEYYKGEEPIDFNVVILAGQSNMAGAYTYVNDIPADSRNYYISNTESVKINYNNPRSGNNTRVNGVPKLSSGTFVNVNYYQGGTQFGPEIGLAKYLALNDSGNNYYLIKVAVPGTNLYNEWNPDYISSTYVDESGKRYIYKIFQQSIENCIKGFKIKGVDVNINIKALCWLQGENDSSNQTQANSYSTNFAKLKNKVKSDFGEYYSPDFKWISASIHQLRCTSGSYGETINTVLQNNSDAFISETYSLPLGDDNLHYTAASMLTIGELFGQKVLS